MDDPLDCMVLESAEQPRYAVIWLHGLGADGSDFVPVVPHLGLEAAPAVRFVFPNAPQIPVTCNGGYVMPAWYDIISLAPDTREVDARGVARSREAIRRLIERENARGIPCARIFLAGFSQGGAIAYVTALTHVERLAGIVALSTYLPTLELVETEGAAANAGLAVFAAHGTEDDVVGPDLGRRARDFLRQRGHPIDWRDYPMPHSVCIEEIIAIGAWLRARMAAIEAGSP